jgi:hypothetical protein
MPLTDLSAPIEATFWPRGPVHWSETKFDTPGIDFASHVI